MMSFLTIKKAQKKGIWKWQKIFALRLCETVLGLSIYHYFNQDAKAWEAAKEMLASTSQSSVHIDSLPPPSLQKRTRLSTGFIHKKDQCV